MTFRGPEGVNARIAEIQSKLDSVSPEPAPGFGVVFEGAVGARPLSPNVDGLPGLTGTIGGTSEFMAMADEAATRNGVDPSLFRALVQQESGWKTGARSGAGAMGLCQLMPDTARELGVAHPYDPAQSLEGGARYLRQKLKECNGDEQRALASYNAGYGRIKNSTFIHWPQETRHYVTSIMSIKGSV